MIFVRLVIILLGLTNLINNGFYVFVDYLVIEVLLLVVYFIVIIFVGFIRRLNLGMGFDNEVSSWLLLLLFLVIFLV